VVDRASAAVAAASRRGRSSSATNVTTSSSESPTRRGPPTRRGARTGHPERLEHGRGEVVIERHPRCGRHLVGRPFEARVGVDAPPFGRCDRFRAVEAEAGGVRQQVSQRGALRGGGVTQGPVELDGALLDGHHHRPRRHRLAERGEAERPVTAVAVGEDRPFDAVGRDDGRGGMVDRPGTDQLERRRLHARHGARPQST
jgi:hypothetical protein